MKNIIEKIKRLPPLPAVYRALNPHYGHCGICGLPWPSCVAHVIDLDETRGFFPYCEYCNEYSSLEAKEDSIKRLYLEWGDRDIPFGEYLEAFYRDCNKAMED